ncbi:MAG TPA: ketoacyl-ACP synthase III [Bryobacteraceae bacterium]|nr:ketoacyl-ACP synthase III [Bryobacteraceae bacterium]
MAAIKGFGSYLPARIVDNAELAARLKCDAPWIRDVSGIEERRYARDDESIVSMAVEAGRQCLERTGTGAGDIGLLIVSSGSSERRFPGPAAAVAHALGRDQAPAIDLPLASAGGLFGMVLAATLAPRYGNVLVVASEKMSSVIARDPAEPGVAILFGDGAGACLISSQGGSARIVDHALHSDGAFADDLRLEFDAPLAMDGRSVIMQASRKIPAVIGEVLERNQKAANSVEIFLMHQANQNLIDRVARSLQVEAGKFFSNIRHYGNTSSASMLIAASEWWQNPGPRPGQLVSFAAFGAGFHWGALLAEGCSS